MDERVVDLSIDTPSAPHEVWDAIATGPGISSWFVPTEVDGRVGGEIRMTFGDAGTEVSHIVEWDPPNRFVHRTGGDAPGTGLTNEWTVDPSDGELTNVRLVVRGFGEDQQDDFEGLSGGWRIFLGNLRLHLGNFRGGEARAITPTAMVPGGHDEAWATFCETLEVPVDLTPGAHFATSGPGVPVLSGTVEETVFLPGQVSAYLILMDAPATGTAFVAAEGDGERVACSTWLYLYDVDADEVEDRWTPFLAERWGDG